MSPAIGQLGHQRTIAFRAGGHIDLEVSSGGLLGYDKLASIMTARIQDYGFTYSAPPTFSQSHRELLDAAEVLLEPPAPTAGYNDAKWPQGMQLVLFSAPRLDLFASQVCIEEYLVAHYTTFPEPLPPILVAKVGDQHWILDGHHRAVAAAGNQTFRGRGVLALVVSDPAGVARRPPLRKPRRWLWALLAPLACLLCPAHLGAALVAILGLRGYVATEADHGHPWWWEAVWMSLGGACFLTLLLWERGHHRRHRCGGHDHGET